MYPELLVIGEILRDHQAAGGFGGVYEQRPRVLRLFRAHLKQNGFQIRQVEFAQHVRAHVTVHLVQDGRGLGNGQILDQVGANDFMEFLDEVRRVLGIEQCQDGGLVFLVEPGDGTGQLGRRQLGEVRRQFRAVVAFDQLLDLFPRLVLWKIRHGYRSVLAVTRQKGGSPNASGSTRRRPIPRAA